MKNIYYLLFILCFVDVSCVKPSKKNKTKKILIDTIQNINSKKLANNLYYPIEDSTILLIYEDYYATIVINRQDTIVFELDIRRDNYYDYNIFYKNQDVGELGIDDFEPSIIEVWFAKNNILPHKLSEKGFLFYPKNN